MLRVEGVEEANKGSPGRHLPFSARRAAAEEAAAAGTPAHEAAAAPPATAAPPAAATVPPANSKLVVMQRGPDDKLGMRLERDVGGDGILVLEEVTAGLLAHKHGIKAGDQIALINGRKYSDAVEAVKALREAFGKIELTLSLAALPPKSAAHGLHGEVENFV
ncbi:hypothetical protein KFE25_000961 [Diacronema lutheri]|uniref:PDZ domain-containing protein n=1 Tax=Diacronema lutheri TaxID=2081491 RepID=A0A8J6C790_DIALT|nr:hypothetical protein KFE25_000961 [Diacronema lutheri]